MKQAQNKTIPTPPVFDTFSIKSVLKQARNKLQAVSETAALDAELLLAKCIQKNQTYLHTWPEKILTTKQYDCFQNLLKKRLEDYPIAYLIGEKPFWTFELLVTPDVLIPRPETELLVETALEKIQTRKQPKILDLGTGSGAIALAIASERPDAQLTASDSSNAALNIAKKNALKYQQEYKLENRIAFIQSNWFTKLKGKKFDLIVSNPPYIAPDDPHLLQTIRHEPKSALTSNNAGMADIEHIIKHATQFMNKNAWLILEHGYDQSQKTQTLLKNAGFINIESKKDLNGIYRISLAQLGG